MNDKSTIKFGTDGWRGIIAEDFTYENVKRVASAMALYLKEAFKTPVVAVGYDTRFGSRRFAETVADILTASGCEVLFSDCALSTPVISSSVVDTKASGGVMISASHNPPEFNGIKFKSPQGCSAPEEVTRRFEALLDKPLPASTPGNRESRNFLPAYLKRITKTVDFNTIKKSSIKVVADPMHGAAAGYLEKLLKPASVRLVSINTTLDPLFGGLHPEPIEGYLEDLKKAVKQNGASCGLATDGDGDRIGVVDERGRYLTPHQVFPLLLYYLCHFKKLTGKVVQAISLGYVSERIAKDFGLEFEETPVGFKYVADRIINEKILMGGEESGGYGYGNYLPERDGILNSMLIIEMLAATRRSLSSLLGEVEKKYGASNYLRTDFVNPGIGKDEFVADMKRKAPEKIAGMKVRQVKDYDGVEFVLEDDSWLLLRPSGTEPVIRVYSESGDIEKTKKIIAWGKRAVSEM